MAISAMTSTMGSSVMMMTLLCITLPSSLRPLTLLHDRRAPRQLASCGELHQLGVRHDLSDDADRLVDLRAGEVVVPRQLALERVECLAQPDDRVAKWHRDVLAHAVLRGGACTVVRLCTRSCRARSR